MSSAEIARNWWQKAGGFIMSRELLLAIVTGLCCITLSTFLGWENNKVVPPNPDPLAHYSQEPHDHLSFMSNWDGPIYLRIASEGYTNTDDTGFFPLYPLLTRAVHAIAGSWLISALLVAWPSFIGALYFYLRIVKQLFRLKDNQEALRAALPFVLFPTGVFLLATYTESLFACLALASLYYALGRRYLASGLCAMLATATHPNGMFVVVLAASVLYEQKERLTKIALGAVIGSLGLLAYMSFLFVRYHNPLQFVLAQRTNGWLSGSGYLPQLLGSLNLLDLAPLLLIVAAVLYWWPRRRSFAVYSALFLVVPVIGGQFGGFDRYSLMVFPLQFMLYDRLHSSRTAYSLLIGLFAVFWSYFMLQYAGGYVGG